MFECSQVNSTTVHVEVSRVFEVGHSYRLSPSYGYAGVTPGVVIIAAMGIAEVLGDTVGDIPVGDLIESYTDANLSLYDKGEDYDRAEEYLQNTIWVLYCYPHTKGEEGEYYVFPIEEFVAHSSHL